MAGQVHSLPKHYAVKILLMAVCALFQTAHLHGGTPSAAPTEDPDCRRFYDGACSEAMGAWLPTFGFASDHLKSATRVRQRDGFVYEHQKRPFDGTFFVYGNAGPPKGRIVYDYAHHIAFFVQGCCSWQDVVAASTDVPPPKHVVSRDLSGLHTVRGVRLGMTTTAVLHIYGHSNVLSVAHAEGVRMLAYTTWPTKDIMKSIDPECGQFEIFYFRHDRLILIQLGDGC